MSTDECTGVEVGGAGAEISRNGGEVDGDSRGGRGEQRAHMHIGIEDAEDSTQGWNDDKHR